MTNQTFGLTVDFPDTTQSPQIALSGMISLGQVPSNTYNIAFVMDVSGSTVGSAGVSGGNPVAGDENKDGLSNTILDAEIAAFRSLYNDIVKSGLSANSRVTLITFDSSGVTQFTGGFGTADANGNGRDDSVEFFEKLTGQTSGDMTNFEAGLQQVKSFFQAQSAVGESNLVVFASDGDNNTGGDPLTLAAQLRAATTASPAGYSAAIRTYAVGSGVSAGGYTNLDNLDDGVANNSATKVTDLGQLATQLTTPPITAANISKVEILNGSTVIATLTGNQLTSTALGLQFNTTIDGLNVTSGQNNNITVKAYASSGEILTVTDNVEGMLTVPQQPTTPTKRGVRFDFDGDGVADVLWRNRGDGNIAISDSARNRAFTLVAGSGGVDNNPGSDYRIVGIGDFNGDTRADILFRNADDSLVAWMMDGPTVQEGLTLATPGRSFTVVGVGDFDGNGKDDILFENRAGSILTVYANGTSNSGGIAFARPDLTWSIQGIDDFNNDGKAEILWRHRDGRLATQAAGGALQMLVDGSSANAGTALTANARVVGTGDVNSDGKADILMREDAGTLYTVLVSGSNSVSAIQTGSTPSTPNWSVVGVGNFAGGTAGTPDTTVEVLWRQDSLRSTGNMSINDYDSAGGSVLSNPGNSWQVVNGSAITRPPRAVQNSDLDGDGNADIIFRNSQTGVVAAWRSDYSFQASDRGAVLATPTLDWTSIGQGDFDGDGKADLLFRNKTTQQVGVWLMDGTKVRRAELIDSIPNSWETAAVGDFTGDGRADVAWRNSDGQVGIWTMNGTTLQLAQAVGDAPLAWEIKGAADFDNDGRSDLLFRNKDSGQVAIWRMNEQAQVVSGSVVSANPGTAWEISGIADFTNDGRGDLLWRNKTTGQVALWRMDGDSMVKAELIQGIGNNWEIQSTGDYNNDGSEDVLWRNTTDNMLAVWDMQPFLNGGSVNPIVVANTLGAEWVVQRQAGVLAA
ncbi:FG-GAP-like repeat-containing protein [Azospirillum himalayense]|uniref:FG-GAP-like repeat-containing protein n=1 Tax=Azospirillum himalayense TaxID=654847 RepID=A0ABW0G2L4_9PROT